MRRKPKRLVAFYPFSDVLDRTSGASQRFNLMLDVLAPCVDSIRVLQAGNAPVTQQGNVIIESTPERIRHRLLRRAVKCCLPNGCGQRTHVPIRND